jgi:putative ABC transport system permease protein
VAEELFGEEDPLGKEIKLYINNRFLPLKVVGVLEETGSKLFLNVDNVVFIPFTTVEQRLLKLDTVNQFFAKAKNSEVVEQAKDELEIFLFSRLKVEDSYKILSQDEILDTINQVTGMLNLVLGAIAGISLLVGGIGIMNIMLVSVTERTREIGIKKAIGAKNSNIMLQFLIESSILTVSAGIIGVIMGMVFSNFIGKFINVTPHFRVDQIILSFVISGLIGLFFGIYPAIKASKLNPVDALRYE